MKELKTEKYVSFTVKAAFSSVQSLSHVRLFATPWTAARQASLSITSSQSFLKLMSIKLVMPSNHPILCCPLFLLSSIFPSIRVFFKWVSSLHQVAKVLELQLQHQSFQWIFRTEHREVQLQIDRAVGGELSKTMEILVITNSKGGESFPGKGSI